jgi:hypothetical protein
VVKAIPYGGTPAMHTPLTEMFADQDKAKREVDVTSRFYLVTQSGFEPELWLRSRLR